MADNSTNSTYNNDKSIKQILNQGVTDSGDGEATDVATDTQDAPVENKFNDYTAYWDPIKEEFVMSTDTPTVRIYISREIVPESSEDEEGSGEILDLEGAVAQSHDMSVIYKNKDINDANTSVVKLNNEQVLAMNAIDKINLK